jgi:hypothetical protein
MSLYAHPYKLGSNYFFRCSGFHYTGRLVSVYENELVLTDAAWIADDGRTCETIISGKFVEVEPYPDGDELIIGRRTVQDAVVLHCPLPRKPTSP